jgi:glutathione S-transferase
MAVHTASHEIGAPFEVRPMSFAGRDLEKPQYLAINPGGEVPTLLIDGRRLTDVAAILHYLAKLFPAASLLPENDPEVEAQAISWTSFKAATLHTARRMDTDHVMKMWTLADRRLGEREWTLGRYSIADIHLFPLYWRLANSPQRAPGIFPNLSAHYQRMMARPAVQRTCEIEAAIGYELPPWANRRDRIKCSRRRFQ